MTKESKVFVFGSNLAGRHGKGAALFAFQNRGANYGQGVGFQGNSYAIPTKDKYLSILSINEIKVHVEQFLKFAEFRPDLVFQVTPIGCGLAGYKYVEIATLFKDHPFNCDLAIELAIPL